jgi:phage tail-like protein
MEVAMAVQRANPYGAYNFLVEIDNVVSAGFAEVEGLGMEIAYAEYRNGNDPMNSPRKLVGLRKFTNITLKRGMTGSTDLFLWLKSAAEGQPAARSVAIILQDEAHNEVLRWRLRHAQPQKWSGPHLVGAAPGTVAMEELVIVHEGLEIE